MSGPFSIICLSSQDWRTALPTNRQQIMLRAAAAGHRVAFVETGHFLGLHLWRLVLRRGRRSLLRRLTLGESGGPRITVHKSAAVMPYGQRSRRAADVNGALTARMVRRMARRLPQPVVLWIYDPLAARTVEACSDFVTVYDCVDDYAEQVGGDARRRRVVSECDERVARAARVVFTTTRTLYERQLTRNRRTCFVRNVGDFAHFSRAEPDQAAPETRLPAPVLGFVGNLISSKVDFDLLRDIAESRPDWSLLLLGPAGTEAEYELNVLCALENTTWLGPRPYADVPAYVAGFDVALIPYRSNAYTRSCFPLKVFEYLAAGKPVVASGLPELEGMRPDVAVAADSSEFVALVERALELRGSSDVARRRALAAENTWDTRAGRLLEAVDDELERLGVAARDVPMEATGPSEGALGARRA